MSKMLTSYQIMQLEKALAEYGLKEKEARVYLAALQVGSGSVLRISQKAGLARSTTDITLKSLRNKGLVSAFRKSSGHYYSAEDPHKIVSTLKSKTETIERSLPKLLALYGESMVRPTVRFYEGKRGIALILDEILDEARELLSFGSAEDLFETVESFPVFVDKRVRAKIPIKVILTDSEKARERQGLGPTQLREVRIIGPEYSHHGVFYIWRNKVAMFSLKQEISVVLIESKELTQLQRNLFMALWDKCEDEIEKIREEYKVK